MENKETWVRGEILDHSYHGEIIAEFLLDGVTSNFMKPAFALDTIIQTLQ